MQPPKKGVGKGVLIGLVVSVLIFAGSTGYVYMTMNNQINGLYTDKTNLQNQVDSLNTNKTKLQSQFDSRARARPTTFNR